MISARQVTYLWHLERTHPGSLTAENVLITLVVELPSN
jgi:hypothetical protein